MSLNLETRRSNWLTRLLTEGGRHKVNTWSNSYLEHANNLLKVDSTDMALRELIEHAKKVTDERSDLRLSKLKVADAYRQRNISRKQKDHYTSELKSAIIRIENLIESIAFEVLSRQLPKSVE